MLGYLRNLYELYQDINTNIIFLDIIHTLILFKTAPSDLNTNRTMDNVQKHNICIYVQFVHKFLDLIIQKFVVIRVS
jgi:hypothetical protein